MTSIPLRMSTVRAYMENETSFRPCQDISNIYIRPESNTDDTVTVSARIPASSTRQGHYDISVSVRSDGAAILWSACTCPVGDRCKHQYKVLCRIAASEPIGGPDRETLEREARYQRLADQMEHASVYIALACKSELDSGSDFRRSFFIKDNYDQEILGVFFSKSLANQCAKDYVQDELGHDLGDDETNEEDDTDEEEDEGDSDYEESFVYDSSDFGEYDEECASDKVWVERRAIEDASPRFRR